MTSEELRLCKERFLLPEERSGVNVSAEMKSVWRAQMDILEVVMRICDKHGIRYFLTDGTLLGAARHQGYIPWDDDIDISMLREDYDRFCEIAPSELPRNYFFQSGATDPEYCDHYVKIRNSDMTAVTEFARKMQYRCNQGMFIDVMPLDVILKNSKKLRLQVLCQKIIHTVRARAVAHCRTSFKGLMLRVVCRIVFRLVGYRRLHSMYEWVLRRPRESGLVGHRFFPFVLPQEHWSAEWFVSSSRLAFEYLECSVPGEWRTILEYTYGDWLKPVKGASFHTELYFNTKESYRTVIPREFGYKVESEFS